MYRRFWAPLPVLQKALIDKHHREITLFLFLKMTTSGRVKIQGKKKSEIMQVLSIGESTLYRRLRTLMEWNWVGYDSKTRVYYIRGFKYIYEKEDFISKTAVKIRLQDLLRLQTFSFSASVGYLLRSQSRRKGRGAERSTWRSKQSPASNYRPVAICVMESLFSLSEGTIIELKKLAIHYGYLKRKRGYKCLYHVSNHSREYYRCFPEHWGLLRRVGPDVALIQPDEFIDYHYYKRKRYS